MKNNLTINCLISLILDLRCTAEKVLIRAIQSKLMGFPVEAEVEPVEPISWHYVQGCVIIQVVKE